MAITSDQQATLQLLLERGQRYGDLAKLLGQDEAEVRARARAALTDLGGADPDRNVGLTDYLLGQADPIGRADASRHLREDPADYQLASELCETLRAMFPAAELPRLPGEPRAPRRRRGTETGDAAKRSSPLAGLSGSQTRVIAIAGGAAVLLLVVVLGVAGAFDGGEEDGSSDSATASETTTTAPADEQLVPITLEPEKGSDAGGVVSLGFTTADQAFMDFQIRQLQPAPQGKAYVLWFLLDGKEGFPLPTPLEVSPQGSLSDRVSVPAEVLAFAQQAKKIVIALNDAEKLNADIEQVIEEGGSTLEFPGGTVLSADLTQQGAANDGGDSGGGEN